MADRELFWKVENQASRLAELTCCEGEEREAPLDGMFVPLADCSVRLSGSKPEIRHLRLRRSYATWRSNSVS
jgi:hypothetical protein